MAMEPMDSPGKCSLQDPLSKPFMGGGDRKGVERPSGERTPPGKALGRSVQPPPPLVSSLRPCPVIYMFALSLELRRRALSWFSLWNQPTLNA